MRAGPSTRSDNYGRCPTCGWLGAVRRNGEIRAHRHPLPDGRQHRDAGHCPGGVAKALEQDR